MNPPMTNPRIFVYCREAPGHPAEEQIAAIARAGFSIDPASLVLEDAPPFEPSRRRPEFCRLLQLLRAPDCLVVGGLDALGRNAVEIHQMISRFAQAGIRLYCATPDKCELTADSGKQVRDAIEALAAIEREQAGARSRSGVARPGTPRAQRMRPPSSALKAEIARRVAAGVPLAQLSREYRLPRHAIIRICSARAGSDEERLLSVPAREATRHTIEAVAMLANDETRRR